ncbi:MAG: response regulator transcription factor [Clostridiales bacterium]|nr:response regulator transcription factor [Clostridiales bacterium]
MKKILIIEDDPSIAEIESDYLQANQYEAAIAPNGTAGAALALAENFDLILLDIMLPDKDGFAVCKEIRAQKQTPILFVSARMDDIDKIKGFAAGADDYICKPFSFHELLARVAARIARYEALTGADQHSGRGEIRIKNLRILTDARRVFLGEKEIPLPNREYELLLFLAQNPGKVFSKEQILNAVWGVDMFVEMNTVAVHINRLREKIERSSANPEFILTVWGAGYKFTDI